MTDTHFDPNVEIDLSGEGLQAQTADLVVVDAGIKDTDRGQRWFVTFEPIDAVIEGLPKNQVTDSGYLTHEDRDDLIRIGKGALKRLSRIAVGTDKPIMSDLVGSQVNAQLSEDDNGFARVRNYRAVK
jgi:hypothetical protein